MAQAGKHLDPSSRQPAGVATGLREGRQHPRRPVLLVMTMPFAGAVTEIVCVDSSASGGYFASRNQPLPLELVELAVRSTVTAGQLVTLCGRVVYAMSCGGARPVGFAVAWQWARCVGSPEPLVQFLGEFLQIVGVADRVSVRGLGHEFDFLRSGDIDPERTTGPLRDKTCMQSFRGQPAIGPRADVLVHAAIPTAAPTPDPGWPQAVPDVLAARYANLVLLGSGGCGVVYRARDLMLDRDVVLKFLKRDSEEIQRTYFLREARLAGSLSHRNIVQVLDVDSVQGRLYYVMQHVPGRTLGRALRDGRLPAGEALRILRELSDALDHAHGHGILHRDVKPENVLLGDDGVVRLFDFGLARLGSIGFGDQSLLVGTPSHMAPEQIRGDAVDQRTDLYSLGVVAYELLTGHLPFESGNLFIAHALDPVPDPRRYRPELPLEVTAVLERALAKLPGARFASCGAFLAALEHALGELSRLGRAAG